MTLEVDSSPILLVLVFLLSTVPPCAPVLYLMWNRPDLVKTTLHNLSRIQPSRLYIACDGPSADNNNSALNTLECRRLVNILVTWPCDIKTLYHSTNLGCGLAVSTSITWFFQNEEAGIILEDDVLCSDSFFQFATELLNYYALDDNIAAISANLFNTSKLPRAGLNSYSFTEYPHIWGWATWRRVWEQYDYNLDSFHPIPFFLRRLLTSRSLLQAIFWTRTFLAVKTSKIDTWDYQLTYLFFKNRLLSVSPPCETAQNIGFIKNSTHDHVGISPLQTSGDISFPLDHPTSIQAIPSKDRATFYSNFFPSPFAVLTRKLTNIISRL